jgi:hypothetical protein
MALMMTRNRRETGTGASYRRAGTIYVEPQIPAEIR